MSEWVGVSVLLYKEERPYGNSRYKSMHAAVEHAAAGRGPGSALVRAPRGCRPAGAE